MQRRLVPPVVQNEFSFRVWSGAPRAMPHSHIHSDIEVNFVASGEITYFMRGRFETVRAGELAVFWAGTPHQLARCDGEPGLFWVVLPLPWFLQWRLPELFTHAVLQTEFLQARSPDVSLEMALFGRWATDFQDQDSGAEHQAIVALEIEARLRRFALQIAEGAPALKPNPDTNRAVAEKPVARQVERIASYLSRHYTRELSVAQIAQEVNLHPKYAMQIFKAHCGLSIGDYLTRLRISHAQRLLLTTDLSITQIALQSGFNSPGRFHAVFRRRCQQTPRAFRAIRAT